MTTILYKVRNNWPLVLLSILGISFWFTLAFPFANRNESYVWIAYLDHFSLVEIVQNQIPTIRNYRPLAQVMAWILYHLSGENIVLAQLMNYILLCIAIWIFISLTDSGRRMYITIAFLFIGFIYISVFYYVFNLHGIFYSPILLQVALLIKEKDQILTRWKRLAIISLALAFLHPFALVIFTAYLSGSLIEKYSINKKNTLLVIAAWALLLIGIKLILPISLLSIINIQNLLGCLHNVEANMIIQLFSFTLCVLTLVNKGRKQQLVMVIIILLYLPFVILNNMPMLLLLGLLIGINLIQERKIALLGLLSAAILFPLVVSSGAPTKAFIMIFLLPYLITQPLSLSTISIKGWIPKATSFSLLFCMLMLVSLLRAGVKVPIISALIKPMLVERGKTIQLERCLLLAKSQLPNKRIQFLQEKQNNIRDKGQPKNRNYFPPAKQAELDVYQRGFGMSEDWETQPKWYISFGEESSVDSLKLIHTLEVKNCMPAYVYSEQH